MEEKLADANIVLLQLTQKLASINQSLEGKDITGLLELYRVTYEAHQALEKTTKALGALKQSLSYEKIPATFKEMNIQGLRHNGRNFVLGERFFASIPADMHEKGYAWLHENGLGGAIKPNINPMTLSSVLEQYIEETGKSPPNDAIKIHMQEYIQMRR